MWQQTQGLEQTAATGQLLPTPSAEGQPATSGNSSTFTHLRVSFAEFQESLRPREGFKTACPSPTGWGEGTRRLCENQSPRQRRRPGPGCPSIHTPRDCAAFQEPALSAGQPCWPLPSRRLEACSSDSCRGARLPYPQRCPCSSVNQVHVGGVQRDGTQGSAPPSPSRKGWEAAREARATPHSCCGGRRGSPLSPWVLSTLSQGNTHQSGKRDVYPP